MTIIYTSFINLFLLFRKTSKIEEKLKNFVEKKENIEESGKIRCPLCHWKPQKSSVWYCADAPENSFRGCYTRWNTFDTGGICPGCNYQWRYTACLSCHKNSPHEDWYL